VSSGEPRRPSAKPLAPLGERVADPGFTPSVRDVDALIDLLADDGAATAVERAIARVGAPAIARLRARLDGATTPVRGRIVRVVARLGREAVERGAPSAECAAILLSMLRDADAKARRNAAIGIGHVPCDGAEEALLAAWTADPRPEMRRSIAGSLGKIGSAAVLPLLRDAARGGDPELARIAGRAAAMVDRTASRAAGGGAGQVDASRDAGRPLSVTALSRSGLEALLIDELAAIASVEGARFDGPGRVALTLRGAPATLFAARTMLSFRFTLAPERAADDDAVPDAVARAVSSASARTVFETFTAGAPRYRIAWADGGHRRAATWATAEAIAALAPGLTNDPTQSTWEVAISRRGPRVDVEIVPRAIVDPRFAWRVGDVPAASHPTIAAALARAAGVRADDVVWDPFVGSGAELVERALLGPYHALIGSDVDDDALAVARRNLERAELSARLERADARRFAPEGVTLVITNPPMGKRVARTSGLSTMLDEFVAHAGRTLRSGGRLVWLAPWPRRSRAAAEGAGLRLDDARSVDMGGFGAEMQRWSKR
jgi:23S rRNA G2445 N2-methylase RlmL